MTGPVDYVWHSLERPADGLNAQLHPDSSQVWLAIDSRGRRHLLVRASGHPAGVTLLSTRGLDARTTEVSLDKSGPLDTWADISCTDRSLNRTFVAVAEDLVRDTAKSTNPLAAVEQTLRAWQWFWGVDAAALSESRALGLFGELWFLDRWAPFPQAVASWHGWEADRHDFSSARMAVEVKTSRSHGVGAPQHHISTLDQLDAASSGPLMLFSIQAIPESNAGNTLTALIHRLRSRLASRVDLLGHLDQGLSLMGWSPAVAEQHQTAYRVAAERLYRVEGEFPRLTRSSFVGGLPSGVDDVAYSVDLAACAPWLLTTTSTDAAPHLADLG